MLAWNSRSNYSICFAKNINIEHDWGALIKSEVFYLAERCLRVGTIYLVNVEILTWNSRSNLLKLFVENINIEHEGA